MDTNTRSGSGVRSLERTAWNMDFFARERADLTLASKIVGALVPSTRRLTQRSGGDARDTDGKPNGRASRERTSQTPLQSLPLKTAATTVAG